MASFALFIHRLFMSVETLGEGKESSLGIKGIFDVHNGELKQQRRRRPRKRHLKSEVGCFNLYRAYSISSISSNVGNFFWS